MQRMELIYECMVFSPHDDLLQCVGPRRLQSIVSQGKNFLPQDEQL